MYSLFFRVACSDSSEVQVSLCVWLVGYLAAIRIFFKIGKAKKVNRVSRIGVCMCLRYVFEICAEGIFVTFPW